LEMRTMTPMNLETRSGRTMMRAALSLLVVLLIMGGAAPALFSQSSDAATPDLKSFAGTWHWMFQQKPIIAMTLVPARSLHRKDEQRWDELGWRGQPDRDAR
jgi:hypothetical protein